MTSKLVPADWAYEEIWKAKWEAYNKLLHYLNTLENKMVPKRDVYHYVMSLRPTPLKRFK